MSGQRSNCPLKGTGGGSQPDLSKMTADRQTTTTIRKRKQPTLEHECECSSELKEVRMEMSRINALLEKYLESNEHIITNMQGNISEIRAEITEIKACHEATKLFISENTSTISAEISKIELLTTTTFSEITETQHSFDCRIKSLEGQNVQNVNTPGLISILENKIAAMEQQARAGNVEIVNLPEKRGENLLSIIMNLAKSIQCAITERDITSIHRVPHGDSKDARPKNVIAKFATRYLCDNFLAGFRAKKSIDSSQLGITGPPNRLYANEHLTLRNKTLFRECREKAKTKEYKYVWIKHGTILLRKSDNSPVIAVRNSQDLPKIK